VIADPSALPYLMTPEQFAELLQVGRREFERMRTSGHLPPCRKIGRRRRWRRDQVLAWLDAGQPPLPRLLPPTREKRGIVLRRKPQPARTPHGGAQC